MDDDASCRGCGATTGWLWTIGNEHWCPSCMAKEIERLRAIVDRITKHWEDGVSEDTEQENSWYGTMRDILAEAAEAAKEEE